MCSACRRVKLAWYHLVGQSMEVVGWHRHLHTPAGTQDLTPGMEEAWWTQGTEGMGTILTLCSHGHWVGGQGR